MMTDEKMILERIEMNERTYNNEVRYFSIKEIVKMVKTKKLQLAEEQRNFVAKATISNGIVFSVISGKGIANVTVNYKDDIYYVVDGCQRLTSLLLYVTGATNEDWKGKVFKCPSNSKTVALSVKGIEDDALYKEYEEMAKMFNKKSFSDLPEFLQKKILNIKIGFVTYKDLPKDKEIQLFIDLNRGSTPLSRIELTKANCNPYIWKKLSEISKDMAYSLGGKNRFAGEKFVAELLTQYINSVYYSAKDEERIFSTKWIDAVDIFVKRYSKKDKDSIDKLFEKFKDSLIKFENTHFSSISFVLKDRKSVKFDTISYKVAYSIFVNRCFYKKDLKWEEEIIPICKNFLNGDGYTRKYDFNGIQRSFKDFCIQGTGVISNVDNCMKLLLSHLGENGIVLKDSEYLRNIEVDDDLRQFILSKERD